MKPPPFTYHAPTSLDEALALLAELSDAKVLAGGQSLVPVLNMRLATPQHIVDINRVPGLDRIEVTGSPDAEAVRVGAVVRHADLEHHDGAAAVQPLLRQAVKRVAHPAIRNRGTTVGSLVHADPSGEMPAVLALTGGTVAAHSTRGVREISAEDFFLGPMETSLEHDELVTSASFPAFPAHTVTAYDELARRSGDYAIAGVALAVTTAGPQAPVVAARVSFVSVTDRPDVLDLGPVVSGHSFTEIATDQDLLAAVSDAVRAHVDPVDDIHATADYRRELSATLCRRLLVRLSADAASPGAPSSTSATATTREHTR